MQLANNPCSQASESNYINPLPKKPQVEPIQQTPLATRSAKQLLHSRFDFDPEAVALSEKNSQSEESIAFQKLSAACGEERRAIDQGK